MGIWKTVIGVMNKAVMPIRRNGLFFFFMYVLGLLVSYLELPQHKPMAEVYDNLWIELFFDLYIVCLILSFFPQKVRPWLRGCFAFIAYSVTLIDLFCWVKFQATLNPAMLLLALETNGREAGEFLNSYFNADVLFSEVSGVLIVALLHLVCELFWTKVRNFWTKKIAILSFFSPHKYFIINAFSVGLSGILIWSAVISYGNKQEMVEMFGKKSIGEVEHELTTKHCAEFYLPLYRLAFSIFSNALAAQQIDRLQEAKDKVQVDGVAKKTENIVLIIGESMGRHHSQQYGYFMPTTPRQVAHEKSGLLTPFSDVVSMWNLTSFVFKNIFSLHVVGQAGDWCDYPMFPQLFRKAGYHVSFITNQFLPQAKSAVYDFSGGFFLNDAALSASMFDTRNTRLHQLDEGLLKDYDTTLAKQNKAHNLIIFHLMGQHVSYKLRYPKAQRHFTSDDYEEKRADLSLKERKMLAHYDNATLYNDSIVDQIIQRFANKEAIVIYMPDHGEECYEGQRGFICRNHSAEIDYDLAHYEFEIPFWIYCSKQYVNNHPEIYARIKQVKDKRFMTDALPHLLLDIAGIRSKYYHPQYDLLSDEYDEMRPRILKNKTDYDKVRKSYFSKKEQGAEKQTTTSKQ